MTTLRVNDEKELDLFFKFMKILSPNQILIHNQLKYKKRLQSQFTSQNKNVLKYKEIVMSKEKKLNR